ncbi:MAG: Type secretion system protein [Candidatus Saccharibacteria bacterium]|nr:Type secretion system protein [Candidatus Saccharibacteria bacterium]
MHISDSHVETLLSKSGLATSEQLVALRDQETAKNKSLQDIVVENGITSEKDLTKLYAAEIDVPFIELNPKEITHDSLDLLSERIARQYNAIVFAEEDGAKLVAMADPDDVQALNFLQKQLGSNIRVHIATENQIQAALDVYRGGNIAGELTDAISKDEAAQGFADEAINEADLAEDSPIAKTVNLLVEYGIKAGASDIHIEPREGFVVVRYRVDGLLREANKLPRKVLGALVSRIKILADLKIDEHRAPQDGRFKISVGQLTYALRVSTLPIVDGEKVVMRILNESSKPATLPELGFWGQALATLQQAIVQPHGMVLVTGPTGSGKSTTLFSVLSLLNTPNVNISTVEDPVEYRIQGVNQTQVNPLAGMTFESGLRALLRQDPNVIMVGEMRDKQTADLGVQAALTGHLVFTTLHTNNAATCLPRLLDMGVEPFLIASTVRAVVGQRLVRRLCVDCRETFPPDVLMLGEVEKTFQVTKHGGIPELHKLEEQALADGIGKTDSKAKLDTSTLSTTSSAITTLYKAHNDGCASCNHTGYKGRIGIYEVLDNSPGLQGLIVSNATSEQLNQTAVNDGMVTMQLDGLIKALRGQTSIEEILRVTAQD